MAAIFREAHSQVSFFLRAVWDGFLAAQAQQVAASQDWAAALNLEMVLNLAQGLLALEGWDLVLKPQVREALEVSDQALEALVWEDRDQAVEVQVLEVSDLALEAQVWEAWEGRDQVLEFPPSEVWEHWDQALGVQVSEVSDRALEVQVWEVLEDWARALKLQALEA